MSEPGISYPGLRLSTARGDPPPHPSKLLIEVATAIFDTYIAILNIAALLVFIALIAVYVIAIPFDVVQAGLCHV